jgi:hypothetical protein
MRSRTRSARAKEKSTSIVTTGEAKQTAFPAQWF